MTCLHTQHGHKNCLLWRDKSGPPIDVNENDTRNLLQLIFKGNVGRPKNDIEIPCLMLSDLISWAF